jgi:hypothetical protein
VRPLDKSELGEFIEGAQAQTFTDQPPGVRGHGQVGQVVSGA